MASIGRIVSCTALVALLLLQGCHRPTPTISAPLPQRGYLWQRTWTPASTQAAREAAPRLAGLILLAAEVPGRNSGVPPARPKIDWAAVKSTGAPIALALRVAPTAPALTIDSPEESALHTLARTLLAEARAAGVAPTEFQIDYDAPQKKLAAYRSWLRHWRAALPGERIVITTLPAWLGETEFAALIAEADGYVLQVHSVPAQAASGRAVLCDPALARSWVARAARLGRPFSVALPTYTCVAGFAPDGKLLGVAMDAAQPAWPAGTRTFEMRAEADELAALISEWQRARPATMREVIWYRVPTPSDVRNWTWPTLAAVSAGRAPVHRLEALAEGDNPKEIVLHNAGEAVESGRCQVVVRGESAPPVAMDALAGWVAREEKTRVVFLPVDGARGRLPPGEKRRIGWIRYERDTPVALEVLPVPPARP